MLALAFGGAPLLAVGTPSHPQVYTCGAPSCCSIPRVQAWVGPDPGPDQAGPEGLDLGVSASMFVGVGPQH